MSKTLIWILYIFILACYVLQSRKLGSLKSIRLKLLLSGMFCIVGFVSMIKADYSLFSILIFGGLAASMVGDYFLAFILTNEAKFIKGILFFGLAHVFYISAMILIEDVGLKEFILTALILVGLILFMKHTKPELGKAKWALSIYVILVTFMAVKGGLMLFTDQTFLESQVLFSVGAVLFLISDTLLGIWRYVWPKQIFSDLLSVFYFIGQLLLASTK